MKNILLYIWNVTNTIHSFITITIEIHIDIVILPQKKSGGIFMISDQKIFELFVQFLNLKTKQKLILWFLISNIFNEVESSQITQFFKFSFHIGLSWRTIKKMLLYYHIVIHSKIHLITFEQFFHRFSIACIFSNGSVIKHVQILTLCLNVEHVW